MNASPSVRIIMAGLFICILLGGCGGVTREDVVGTYKLVYRPGPNTNLGSEILVLRADGTFVQTFKPTRGEGWNNGGRWKLDRQFLSTSINLTHRLMPIDWKDEVINPPEVEDGGYPIWRSGSTIKIEVEPDIPYHYIKAT